MANILFRKSNARLSCQKFKEMFQEFTPRGPHLVPLGVKLVDVFAKVQSCRSVETRVEKRRFCQEGGWGPGMGGAENCAWAQISAVSSGRLKLQINLS